MDPNVILAKLVAAAQEIVEHADDYPFDAYNTAEDFLSLHYWITNGGFLPAAWVTERTP